ncbi:glycerol-3-phosphate acyltransferase [Paenibacillus oryzisoli]|uniref:glycerol-3-phosphate acyltransferase n=1 Tax=Paenibacillus oryzisoli TaxID=1850517 RepID=UPI003D2CC20A
MIVLFWTLCAFVSGSLMFSYWLGRLARHNLRSVGDGNPGALNLWQSAGYRLGLAGIVLDFGKGYGIVLAARHWGGMEGYALIPVGLAPIIGHAFSPFLKGRGGKAIAVTFGVWSALSRFEVSLALAVILAILQLVMKIVHKWKPISSQIDGQQVVLGVLLLGVYLLVRGAPAAWFWIWAGNAALIVVKHRREILARLGKKKEETQP